MSTVLKHQGRGVTPATPYESRGLGRMSGTDATVTRGRWEIRHAIETNTSFQVKSHSDISPAGAWCLRPRSGSTDLNRP